MAEIKTNLDPLKLKSGLLLACDWVTEIAQLKTENFPPDTRDTIGHLHKSWKGAIRGEYSVAQKQWDFFCPVWHTGQAVKALVLAAEYFKNERYQSAARLGADFIINNQIWNPENPDHGLILAYEDYGDKVTTSAILESMHGLILLADTESSSELWSRLTTAGNFLIDKLYMPQECLFRDLYDPAIHCAAPNPYRTKNNIGGRPLLDDSIMLRLYHKTKEKHFLDVHIKISETLVREQNPKGNWIDYGPCNPKTGSFHPRHTYWWGLPLLGTYRETGREEFLHTALACGEFLKNALREDGGYFRGYYLDGKTDSFGHATSGSACAAIFCLELFKVTHAPEWMALAQKALSFCLSMQFTSPEDPNLKGAILEKVLPPNGKDLSPYHIRDLGTIFFITAGCLYLKEFQL
ncbi:MAG: hypothetical protein WC975_12220 [Phycisphaerae bacterium]